MIFSKYGVQSALRSLVRDSQYRPAPDEKILLTSRTVLPGPSAPVVTLVFMIRLDQFL